MARKKKQKPTTPFLFVFVEGETDKVFFESFLQKMIELNPAHQPIGYKIFNLKGFGNFSSKLKGKYQNQLKKKYNDYIHEIACIWDFDVFEFADKPPVNWKEVQQSLERAGANQVILLEIKNAIEDWFLLDKEGLAAYLKLQTTPSALKGKNGNEKMKFLFRKANKIYQKGTYCDDFISNLDLEKIYTHKKVQAVILPLENILFPLKNNSD